MTVVDQQKKLWGGLFRVKANDPKALAEAITIANPFQRAILLAMEMRGDIGGVEVEGEPVTKAQIDESLPLPLIRALNHHTVSTERSDRVKSDIRQGSPEGFYTKEVRGMAKDLIIPFDEGKIIPADMIEKYSGALSQDQIKVLEGHNAMLQVLEKRSRL